MDTQIQFKKQLHAHKYDAITSDLDGISYEKLAHEYDLAKQHEATSWKQVRNIAVLIQMYQKSSNHNDSCNALMQADEQTIKLKLYSPDLKPVTRYFFSLISEYRSINSQHHRSVAAKYVQEQQADIPFIDKLDFLVRSCQHYHHAIDYIRYDNLAEYEKKIIRRRFEKSERTIKMLVQDLNDVEAMTLFACQSNLNKHTNTIAECITRFEKNKIPIISKIGLLIRKQAKTQLRY